MEYREYRPGDEIPLNDLYNEVFERDRTVAQWKWEYLDTPEGVSKIAVVDDGGRVIAHEAMIPMRFWVFDREILGGKIEDAYIAKAYRGKKLFGPLTEYCLDISRRDGYALTFGLTARPVNYKLHVSRGYRHICSLNAYCAVFKPAVVASDIGRALGLARPKAMVLKLATSAAARRFAYKAARYSRQPDAYPVERVPSFDDRFERMWQAFVAAGKPITIRRSLSFLNWRYVDNPYREYAVFAATRDGLVVGYLVAGTIDRPDMGIRCSIGVTPDFLVLPGHEGAFSSLLKSATAYWRSHDTDMAISWVHRDGTYSRPFVTELRRCGFLSTFGRYDIPFFVRTLTDDITSEAIYDPVSWHVTQAFGGAWV